MSEFGDGRGEVVVVVSVCVCVFILFHVCLFVAFLKNTHIYIRINSLMLN